MTVPALLSHFGVNVPRYVTMNGEIVFRDVVSAGGGYAHVTHGPVTPVATHTFHGGANEPDDDAPGPTVWWDDEAQISRHVEAMQHSFPSFAYLPADEDLGPGWVGEIDTGRGKFTVGIIMRRDGGLPTVAVLGGPRLGAKAGRRWEPAPHLYDNGTLCVAGRGDWDPAEPTAATVTAWAAHWLAAYTEWRMSRLWPVEGVRAVAV